MGSLVELVPKAVIDYGVENIGPGDTILVNDPYGGGGHLNDITLITPVYYNDEPFGYVANVAHHVDVGGGAPASVGAFREVYQEGVIIPPVKLVRGGEMLPDIFRLVISQIRSKRETGWRLSSTGGGEHYGNATVARDYGSDGGRDFRFLY